MKPSLYLLIPALFLVSCDQQEIDASKLVIRDDITYEVNSNTPFTGVSLTYHENEQVDKRVTFRDGKLDGLYESYRQNGELIVSRNFKEGKMFGEEAVDLSDLEEREDGFYEIGSDTPFTGISLTFHGSGPVDQRMPYKDGVQDGMYETYHENGQLDLKGPLIDGVLDGMTERYYENGQLSGRQFFRDGKLNGMTELYYENGQLSVRSNWRNGEFYGTAQFYCRNGQRSDSPDC